MYSEFSHETLSVLNLIVLDRCHLSRNSLVQRVLSSTVWVKKSPLRFSDIFPKWMGMFDQLLHTYYTFLSTLDYKFLFNYLQL